MHNATNSGEFKRASEKNSGAKIWTKEIVYFFETASICVLSLKIINSNPFALTARELNVPQNFSKFVE